MKANNKHINQLLRRWISGDITAAEERELERAATEDEFVRESLAGYRSQAKADHGQRLTALRKRLPLAKAQAPVRKLRPWMRIAAAVALLVVAGWAVFQTQGLTDKSTAVAQNEATESTQSSAPTYDEKTAPQNIETVESLSEPPTETSEEFTQTRPETTAATAAPAPPNKRPTPTMTPAAVADAEQARRLASASDNAQEAANSDQLAAAEEAKKLRLEKENAAAKDQLAITLEPNIQADADEVIATTPPPPPTAPEPNAYARQDRVLTPTDLEDRERTTNAGVRVPQQGFRLIEGTVTDDEGYPLIGASILEKGSANGTVTDMDGSYQLTINRQASTLQVSYTGYETQEVVLSGQQEENIILAVSQTLLDEVVVSGYGNGQAETAADDAVSQQAAPTDGYAALRDYIQTNAMANTGRATVKLRFDISADGRPSNFRVIRTTNPSLNAEAIRLLEEGPIWVIESGEAPVEVVYRVRFR